MTLHRLPAYALAALVIALGSTACDRRTAPATPPPGSSAETPAPMTTPPAETPAPPAATPTETPPATPGGKSDPAKP